MCMHVNCMMYAWQHPLSRDELHAKTMRGLAKREAVKKSSGGTKGNRKAAR